MLTLPVKHKKYQFDDLLSDEGKDAINFIKQFVKIETPNNGIVDFDLYPAQERMIDHMAKNDRTIIRKSRQVGLSSTVMGFAVQEAAKRMMAGEEYNIIIVAHNYDHSTYQLRRFAQMLDSIPLNITFDTNNKRHVKANSLIDAIAVNGKPGATRSHRADLVIVDEADYIDDLERVMHEIEPSIADGGKVIMYSSPSTVEDTTFKNMFVHETDKANIETDQYISYKYLKNYGRSVSPKIFNIKDNQSFTYYPAEILWQTNPKHDFNWEREQRQMLGKEQALRELDAFIEGV